MLICWREASKGQTLIVAAGAQRGQPLDRFGGRELPTNALGAGIFLPRKPLPHHLHRLLLVHDAAFQLRAFQHRQNLRRLRPPARTPSQSDLPPPPAVPAAGAPLCMLRTSRSPARSSPAALPGAPSEPPPADRQQV